MSYMVCLAIFSVCLIILLGYCFEESGMGFICGQCFFLSGHVFIKGAHRGPDQKTAQLHQQHGEKALSLTEEKYLDRHTWGFLLSTYIIPQ
jgi:tRNA pseudouridine-54 N-methylase